MHFTIVVCYAFVLNCKKSSMINLSSIITDLDVLHVFKMSRSPWVWEKEKSHKEQDQANREAVPVRQCSSRLKTARYSAYPIPLLFKHALISVTNFQTLSFPCLSDLRSFKSSTDDCHLPYPLDVDLSPAYWKPPARGVIFHLFEILFELLVPLKNMCVWHGVITEVLQVLVSFSHRTKNFRFIRSSVLVAERSKKSFRQKYVKKSNGCEKLRLELYTPKISC